MNLRGGKTAPARPSLGRKLSGRSQIVAVFCLEKLLMREMPCSDGCVVLYDENDDQDMAIVEPVVTDFIRRVTACIAPPAALRCSPGIGVGWQLATSNSTAVIAIAYTTLSAWDQSFSVEAQRENRLPIRSRSLSRSRAFPTRLSPPGGSLETDDVRGDGRSHSVVSENRKPN